MNFPDPIICSGNALPRIILAVQDAKRREAYLSALGSSVECTLTKTLKDIPQLLRQAPCSGILIDIFLKVKSSQMDKVRISDSLEAMPSATLNLDAKTGAIRLLMLNQKYGAARTVEEFATLCTAYQPEALYSESLCSLHLNTILSASPEFGEDSEKTFTMFISGSGCFLFTASPERYQPDTNVWMDFVGIAERNPVMGKVCWQCQWGVSHNVPGIYVAFESILENQYNEIMSLLAIERDKTSS